MAVVCSVSVNREFVERFLSCSSRRRIFLMPLDESSISFSLAKAAVDADARDFTHEDFASISPLPGIFISMSLFILCFSIAFNCIIDFYSISTYHYRALSRIYLRPAFRARRHASPLLWPTVERQGASPLALPSRIICISLFYSSSRCRYNTEHS